MGVIYRNFNNKTLMLVDDSYKGSPILCYTPDIMIISKETYGRCCTTIKIDMIKGKVIFI